MILLLTASPPLITFENSQNFGRKKPRNERLEATFFSIRYGLASEMSDVATQPMRVVFFSKRQLLVLFHASYIVHGEIVLCLYVCFGVYCLTTSE